MKTSRMPLFSSIFLMKKVLWDKTSLLGARGLNRSRTRLDTFLVTRATADKGCASLPYDTHHLIDRPKGVA
jgi:hypothetical protein